MNRNTESNRSTLSRRTFLKASGAGAALAAAASFGMPVIAAEKTIKIGYVSPQSGPLAAFAEADNFVLKGIRETLSGGLKIGGKALKAEIVVRDSQSNPNRAAEVAADLINKENVQLMLVASTPETTNPVSDQCEVAELPCVSTMAPWQPWFFGRGGAPDKGFEYTYHFFWGLEDVIAVFTNLWGKVATNKTVGGLFPNDGDGNAWGDPKVGFPPVLAQKGFKLVDPGRYQNLTDDFSAQIAKFKEANCEIITGVVLPPDWTTFWNQAKQQGFTPKIASVGKAILFPVSVEALGKAGDGLSSEIWWSPSHPFKSSLNGMNAKALADAYEADTKKQWTQPIGFIHGLFEVGLNVLGRSADPFDRKAVLKAITETKVDTIVGPVAWGAGPVKNVTKTPLVGGQWKLGGKFKYELVVTSNETAPNIPVGGEMKAIG
jgi:branched-chain amino acid transport system substrate-binding protein